MIANANVTKIVEAPSDKVWQAIKSIGGLDRWFPVITTCQIEGEGIGAIQILGLTGGGELRDRIVEIADTERRLRYKRFQSPFPVKTTLAPSKFEMLAVNDLRFLGPFEIDVDADKKDEVVGFLESALSDGIDGLEQDVR